MSGYRIPFFEYPSQSVNDYPNQSFSTADTIAIGKELKHLQDIGAVRQCAPVQGQFLSSIFLVPKSNGEMRFILNLKKLNKFVSLEHFKMEDVRTAVKLMNRDCFMANLDLKEAYFLVLINEHDRKFLRFCFNGTLFEFSALPFGLCTAPCIFTKLLKPVMATLRSRGFLSVNYLDDILCLGDSYSSCLQNISETINLLTELGFIINFEKSVLIPSKVCQFLGFVLNSRHMRLELPDRKKQGILDQTRVLMHQTRISVRDFARYVGTLTAACPAVRYGWAHTKAFERVKYLSLLNNPSYERVISLPDNIQGDLIWWQDNILKTHNPIRISNYTLEIFTDASKTGWGASCRDEKIGGFWTDEERLHHINYLELLAAFFGLKSFANNLDSCEILMRIDNTTAISYINRMGGVQFTHLNDITQAIWKWCEDKNIFIFASYIRSCENTDADAESRNLNIDTEWELSSDAFREIVSKFGNPEIDLFASRINTKCEKYISWKRDPYALNIDAFTINWHDFFFYAFPPFSLVLKVLQKIKADKATGILIVPHWPAQPWYPVFMSLSIVEPITFPPSKRLLSSVFSDVHPLHHHLSLVASILSGKPSQRNTFRNRL